jgi:HAT1-interacting factor 1
MATTIEDAPDATAPAVPHTKEKLEELVSAAALQYTLKNFSKAADLYSSASEIQATLNGELAAENAELLFFYGRALYKVAMQKSDVLGGKVAQGEKKKPKADKKARDTAESGSSAPANGNAKEETVETKPYFQIEGDENWTDSEDEEDDAEGGDEEEEDDFQNSYETFELARVCYNKQLEALENGGTTDKGKGKAEITPQARAIKEKLADCYGFLAEIGLENENFREAITDARSSLALQEELHPIEDERVSEAHYVLSLALEMASNTKVREDLAGKETDATADDAEAQKEEEQYIDYDLRNEAAEQTELAIKSVEARLTKEEAALAKPDITDEAKKEKEAIIKNKRGALEDLKTRVRSVPC